MSRNKRDDEPVHPIAEAGGYREVSRWEIPPGWVRDELEGFARFLEEVGDGPARFYLRPDGVFTVLGNFGAGKQSRRFYN